MELTDNERTLRQCKFLTALPVYNEASTVEGVLDEVSRYCDQILVVDDGSSDGTPEILSAREDVVVMTHSLNQGYGAALQTAFQYASDHDYDILVTIDCDGQHEPQRILKFVETCVETGADIVSGSRYLRSFDEDSPPPEQRRLINHQVTKILNQRMGFEITDAFCGFKAYRVESLDEIRLSENGYAMPLELWVQAACHELSVVEVAVPRIYLDENRSFGDSLDDPATRLNYYYDVMNRAFASLPSDCERLRSMRVG
ncbi:glycosyltransferase family 2 protein [Mariniblastus sp.]|nr:glycosyltransferase family 2 protein [bacterium]MDC0294281.1 glycosyltransferase family 2 protein [Mariniblastus sp.]